MRMCIKKKRPTWRCNGQARGVATVFPAQTVAQSTRAPHTRAHPRACLHAHACLAQPWCSNPLEPVLCVQYKNNATLIMWTCNARECDTKSKGRATKGKTLSWWSVMRDALVKVHGERRITIVAYSH